MLPLGRRYKTRAKLGPDATVADVLEAAGWPSARLTVLLVGDQPVLGEVVARLLNLKQGGCAIRKGAVWWLRSRERDGHEQTVVVAVQSPDCV